MPKTHLLMPSLTKAATKKNGNITKLITSELRTKADDIIERASPSILLI